MQIKTCCFGKTNDIKTIPQKVFTDNLVIVQFVMSSHIFRKSRVLETVPHCSLFWSKWLSTKGCMYPYKLAGLILNFRKEKKNICNVYRSLKQAPTQNSRIITKNWGMGASEVLNMQRTCLCIFSKCYKIARHLLWNGWMLAFRSK